MCGIVGIIGDIGVKDKALFADMLYLDYFRGPHSTGILTVPSHRSVANVVTYYKSAVPAFEFLQDEKVETHINKWNVCLIGHNRYATKGAVENKNAHPFKHGNIWGVHNGTLTAQWRLPEFKNFVSDSENIFFSINKLGVDETVSLLQGSYALVWYNSEEKTVSFLRNKERPLCYTFSEDKKTLYFMSESLMLSFLLQRSGIKHDKIKEFKVDTLHALSLDGLGSFPAAIIGDFEEKELKGFTTPPATMRLPRWGSSNNGPQGKKTLGDFLFFTLTSVVDGKYSTYYTGETRNNETVRVFVPQGSKIKLSLNRAYRGVLDSVLNEWGVYNNTHTLIIDVDTIRRATKPTRPKETKKEQNEIDYSDPFVTNCYVCHELIRTRRDEYEKVNGLLLCKECAEDPNSVSLADNATQEEKTAFDQNQEKYGALNLSTLNQ